jgi:hypothetical protein
MLNFTVASVRPAAKAQAGGLPLVGCPRSFHDGHGTNAYRADHVCKSVFLDFVHSLYFNKITTFRKVDILQVNKEGQKP